MSIDGTEDNSWKVVVVMTVCLLVSIVFVGLRFYVRWRIVRKVGSDDQVLAATLVVNIAVSAITASSIPHGLGRHFGTLSLWERATVLRLIWIASIGYGALIILAKMAFLLQYRRAFPLPQFQRACDIFAAFLVAWGIAGTIGATLNCQPIEKNWDPLASRDCRERLDFWLAMGVLNVITDVLIFILPLPLLRKLPLPTPQKAVLIGVFSLGFFTCAISTFRLVTLRASTLSEDPTWTMPYTVIWSVAEVTCAIMCACIPTLRPLLRRYAGWRTQSNDSDDSIIFREVVGGRSRTRPSIREINTNEV